MTKFNLHNIQELYMKKKIRKLLIVLKKYVIIILLAKIFLLITLLNSFKNLKLINSLIFLLNFIYLVLSGCINEIYDLKKKSNSKKLTKEDITIISQSLLSSSRENY